MGRRAPKTVMELCIARAGVLKGARVAQFIAQWTIATQSVGHPITLEEYAEWWHESRATSFRHQARFREVFPMLDTPQPIANAAMARASEWQTQGVAGIGQLPASIVTAG